MAPLIATLYQRMYQLTRPECDNCRAPRSCCDALYCEMAIEVAQERYGETLVPVAAQDRIKPDVLFLSKARGGCVVPPHMRPLCTLHTCDISALGFKRNDPGQKWTQEYFRLRVEINQAEAVLRKPKKAKVSKTKKVPKTEIVPDSHPRLKLIEKWSDWFYDHTTSFAGSDLGIQLSYLWAAMAKGTACPFAPTDEIITLLRREKVPLTESIWHYIELTED